MVESQFGSRIWSSVGPAHHGAANTMDAVPVSTRACLAGLVLSGLLVVCLRASGGRSCGVVGARLSGRLMVGFVCVGFVAPLLVVVLLNVVCAADTSVSALASCVLVSRRAAQCVLSALVGRVRNGRVAVLRRIPRHGRRRAWCTTVLPSRWTLFLFRPMHAWLVWCWPACVRSAYGH